MSEGDSPYTTSTSDCGGRKGTGKGTDGGKIKLNQVRGNKMAETGNEITISMVMLFTEGTGRAGGMPVFWSVGPAVIIL